MPRTTFETAFGRCGLSWSEQGVTRFELPDAFKDAPNDSTPPKVMVQLIERVRRHLAGQAQDFAEERYAFSSVTEFNLKVYQATLKIKAGRTATYGEIASALGYPSAVSRAVGSALGANPWPLLIPCHRIVAADGHMTGFSGPGGITTKLRLLALEGSQLFAE